MTLQTFMSHKKTPSQDYISTLAFMTVRKTCHYYKKTKCGSTTDNNEPIVVLPDHCDPKINNTVQKFSYFMAFNPIPTY